MKIEINSITSYKNNTIDKKNLRFSNRSIWKMCVHCLFEWIWTFIVNALTYCELLNCWLFDSYKTRWTQEKKKQNKISNRDEFCLKIDVKGRKSFLFFSPLGLLKIYKIREQQKWHFCLYQHSTIDEWFKNISKRVLHLHAHMDNKNVVEIAKRKNKKIKKNEIVFFILVNDNQSKLKSMDIIDGAIVQWWCLFQTIHLIK